MPKGKYIIFAFDTREILSFVVNWLMMMNDANINFYVVVIANQNI